MTEVPNAVVVLARCSREKQSFGIRLEEKASHHWTADWAFPLGEAAARRERYDRTEIAGTFAVATTYPGCPYCGAPSYWKCSCGRVACWDGETRAVTCPWCGTTGEITGEIDSLSAGGDR